jgi:hypothetical protein
LRSTDNYVLQSVRHQLIERLFQEGALQGTTLALDSAPIPVLVRENNLKASVRDRFNKTRFPTTDPQARLGAYRAYVTGSSHRVYFFWGYRNHITVDLDTELPLSEQTHPANFHETGCAISLLQTCRDELHLPIQSVCADSNYDTEPILAYIIEQLRAEPIIASHPRRRSNPQFRVKGKVVLCPADLPMVSKGRMTPKRTGITYQQYCCPLHYSKKSGSQLLFCPAQHPKFFTQKGCNYLLRLSHSYRSQIPYGSSHFVELYKKRTSIERVFSRLLSIVMQKPTVYGLQAIRNHCTIAHITVLLVATAAYHEGHHDKLAFVRSFVPNFMGGL